MNVTAERAENEGDERGYVFGFANAENLFLANEGVERRGVIQAAFAGKIFQPARKAISSYRTGVDRVYLDLIANAHIRHGFGERKQSCIDGAADGELRTGCASASAGDVHERA